MDAESQIWTLPLSIVIEPMSAQIGRSARPRSQRQVTEQAQRLESDASSCQHMLTVLTSARPEHRPDPTARKSMELARSRAHRVLASCAQAVTRVVTSAFKDR